MKIPYIVISLLSIFIFSELVVAGNSTIYIHDAWVKEGPPTAKVLAAYLTIKNIGNKSKVLSKIESVSFEKVEIHRSVMRGDMASMVKEKKLEIPPKSSVVMKQGAYHLMLIRPEKRLSSGDHVELKFHFSDGEEITIDATILKSSGAMTGHGNMEHSGH